MKKNLIIFGSIFVLLSPIIGITALIAFNKNVFDNPNFWYSYMAYFGTVTLAAIALWQNQTANDISKRFDTMNLMQNYCFARATKGCKVTLRYNQYSAITLSANHKKDSGAIITITNEKIDETTCFNEYLFELYYKDYSKAALKSFEINLSQMISVQEPCEKGLCWRDNSSDPIPTGFSSLPSGSNAIPKWVANDTFIIRLKIYAKINGLFTNMIENSAPVSIAFPVDLISVSGIITKMNYNYWIIKKHDGIVVEHCESQLIKVIMEDKKHGN